MRENYMQKNLPVGGHFNHERRIAIFCKLTFCWRSFAVFSLFFYEIRTNIPGNIIVIVPDTD